MCHVLLPVSLHWCVNSRFVSPVCFLGKELEGQKKQKHDFAGVSGIQTKNVIYCCELRGYQSGSWEGNPSQVGDSQTTTWEIPQLKALGGWHTNT